MGCTRERARGNRGSRGPAVFSSRLRSYLKNLLVLDRAQAGPAGTRRLDLHRATRRLFLKLLVSGGHVGLSCVPRREGRGEVGGTCVNTFADSAGVTSKRPTIAP